MDKHLLSYYFINMFMLVISLVVMKYMMWSGVEFINLIRLEFMFMMIIIMSANTSLSIYLMIIMLSGVSSIIFMILYIKSY